jgi:hypothetical protein
MRNVVLLVFCLASALRAQYPPDTQWRRIRTQHFDVIFPHGIEAEATMMRGGAGQFASSEATTRALLLSGQHYSFMKAEHGSYKDAVPSPDELGSLFSQPAIVNTEVKSVFTGYYQPMLEADGSVLAQKMGMDSYPVEVVRLRPDGREQRLFRYTPSVMASNRTSVVKGRMVWDEYVPDVRWLRGYSEILIRPSERRRPDALRIRTAILARPAARRSRSGAAVGADLASDVSPDAVDGPVHRELLIRRRPFRHAWPAAPSCAGVGKRL